VGVRTRDSLIARQREISHYFYTRGWRALSSENDQKTPNSQSSRSNSWLDSPTHWMPIGVREWLDGVERWWWHRGVDARLRVDFEKLHGREGEIRAIMEENYKNCYERNLDCVKDGPSRSHLKRACLVLATYKTLLPWTNQNSVAVIDMIRQQSGAASTTAVHQIVRVSLFLSRSPYSLMVRAMRALKYDYGKTFEFNQVDSSSKHCVVVSKCFYNDLFKREGVPELTQCCCCSIDSLWFESLDKQVHGVEFQHSSSMADGASVCEMCLRQPSAVQEP